MTIQKQVQKKHASKNVHEFPRTPPSGHQTPPPPPQPLPHLGFYCLGFFLKNPENSVPSRKILTLHQKKALKEQLFTKMVAADLLE
jgi:hypothetical protein